ncbi:phage terminase large subunit family protein [Janthinobacterium sp. NKUCC08_JDC]|uniref:phage terminase large subunit family protein n=1 Tax=Janthinobacterium sp. NKUCC08_JDC TaxID=2842122 RepID=UPI00214C272A|nr:phage terminase large subunit family protein [Janthinobacterium sp. NKUCC08_JDC]
MSDLAEVLNWRSPELSACLTRGLGTFGVPEPMTLDEWAAKHFYLSKESSYVEQAWEAWPFQRAIMACISNNDIREVDFMKSARVGYTKMLLAAIAYFIEHKRRNQALWQPTDGDSDEFVKTELETMLRDVKVMRKAFPSHMSRNKDNTLLQKKFLGCLLHTRGGKAARSYRRISVDNALLDELDAFDSDIEKEGDPITLAAKRVEGATFPKLVAGSTPGLKGFSLIEARFILADARFQFAIPCPDCGEFHALTWGGKDETHGFKWLDNDPDSVRHMCPHCDSMIDQGQYLAAAPNGRWQNEDASITIDHAGVFRNASGAVISALRHIAFHVWTAYSPLVTWATLVREFINAHNKAQEGDITSLKTFTNTTLGRTWELDVEKTDSEQLKQRAEPYKLGSVPHGCVRLLAGADTQPNRIEIAVWGYGRGCQKWIIDYRIFYGNPDEDAVWADVAEYLFENKFRHASGQELKIHGTAIDSGGHNTHAVYAFCAANAARRVFAVKGRSGKEKHIKDGATKVDIDWRGRIRKHGALLWQVGTNLAKDLIYGRLQITRPGPGYIHFSKELPDEFFKQMAGEIRAERITAGGTESRWSAIRKRVEAWDCTVYAVWLETHFELAKKTAKWWDQLEEEVQPTMADLFAEPLNISEPAAPARAVEAPKITAPAKPAAPTQQRGASRFASDNWSKRGFK